MNSSKNGVEVVYKRQDSRLFRVKLYEIINSLKDPVNACQGGVNPEYVQDQARKADVLILSYDVYASGVRGELRGFTLVNFMQEWLYIDVICKGKSINKPLNNRGKPYSAPGKAMIELVTAMARDMKKRGVVLSALRTVVKYYERLGFKVAARELDMGRDPCFVRRAPNRAASRPARTPTFYSSGPWEKETGFSAEEKKKLFMKVQHTDGVLMARCL